ncbi:hypothetical protein FRC11_010354, partial [Ceratobasidium sp. 423]
HLTKPQTDCNDRHRLWVSNTLSQPSQSALSTHYSSSSDSSIEPSEPDDIPGDTDDEPGVNPTQVQDVDMGSAVEHEEDIHMSSPPPASEDGADLEEMINTNGQTVFVERYPNANAGQPIRRVEPRDLPNEYQMYPDVGVLDDPENFEVAKLLMESGVSGRFRNQYLTLKRAEIGDKFASVISVIVSSDETRLTNFAGDKKAHLVYLTIGNLPKRLRRKLSSHATILIGYLLVPKLDCEPNADAKRQLKRNLFHHCVWDMLKPLTQACANGGVEVPCADGGVRRIYPVLAAYVADFPEQCKVACVKQNHCPLCTTLPKTRGDPGDLGLRDREHTLKVMKKQEEKGSAWFTRYGLVHTDPFWKSHSHVDIGSFLTPDLLHQVHKGVMKDHLIKWVMTILGKSVMDKRYTSMPEAHGLWHFKNGISSVSQWTRRELKEMIKVLLLALSDADHRVVRVAHALMDFMYLAHRASLTDEDLDAMEDALRTFHDNKDVFKELGAVTMDKGFHGIPKLHMISHYIHLIRELGTPDGYNTETSERLHIDFAKMGYRASNKVNATKQMALYIQQLEAIAMHAAYLEEKGKLEETENEEDNEDEDWWDTWVDEEEEADRKFEICENSGNDEQGNGEEGMEDEESMYAAEWDIESDEDNQGERLCYPCPEVLVAKTPTVRGISVDYLIRHHGAGGILFFRHIAPDYCNLDLGNAEEYQFNIWTRVRLLHPPPPFKPSLGPNIDVIRAQPEKSDRFDRISKPARFDTVLVLTKEEARGIHRYRPARVWVVFELPAQIRHVYAGPLAFVEMFNYCSNTPEEPTALYTTTHSHVDGQCVTTIVLLSSIRMMCHLAP